MDEERDENNKELKPHVSKEVKVESSVASPGLPDVTVLHHNSDSDRRVSKENDENHSLDPVDARHLDSVFQYTSKIRQFIGLVDPKEVQAVPVSSPESEIPINKSDGASNSNLEKNDDINEKLTELDQVKNDADLTTKDDGVPRLNIPSHGENDPNVKEPFIPSDENKKELLPLSVDKESEKSCIGEDNNKSGQCDKNETDKPRISEEDSDQGQQKSQPIIIEDVESPTIYNFGNTEVTAVDLSSDNEEKNLLKETNKQKFTDDVSVTIPDAEAKDNLPELNEKDTIMPIHFPDDKIKSPLLEPEENEICCNDLDLNKPEIIVETEEAISGNEENNLEDEANSDSNVSMPKNEEQIVANLDKTENSKMLDDPHTSSNEEEQITSTQDSNLVEDNVTNHLSNELYAINEEQDSYIAPNEIEETPHFEDIRRLSVEIVNKVLDTAGTQLRDILNEKRKSNADANNLQGRSSDLEIASISHEEAVNALNSQSVNVSHDEDKNNLTMSESDSSQLSEPPEVKHKLNNEVQLKEVLAKTYDSIDFQKKIDVEMNKFEPNLCEMDPDVVCGIGCFKPSWIQPWATSRVYLILYSIIGILSGSYYSYLIGTISTLEKRFAFKSKTSGSLMILDEITPLLLGVFIGYFGGKTHRPRMVGFGMLLSSICCFISALPYFIYGAATHLSLGYSTVDNEKKLELCNEDVREGFCEGEDRVQTSIPVLLLMIGCFLKGFGNLSYYAVGLAYMDDNAKKKNTPMYFAIAFSLRLLGPMLGFLMSSFFLKYYENPFVDPGFEPSDPRWIGCWWMGFLVQGVLLLIFTIPISLFPRRLPGTVDYTKSEDQHLANSFVGLYAALKRLAKNPVYILIVLNVVMGIYGSFGHYINLPRYMENQFRLSASTASLISGPPSIGAVMISMTIGGYLIWKFKPSVKFLAATLCASELLQTCAYFILMIPKCQRVEMTSYGFNNDGLNLQSECNNNCNCTTSAFSPVCGPDGLTMFFSPCHAGCSGKVNGVYLNCSCVFDSSGQQRDYVTDGFCITEDCLPSILAYILTMPAVQLIVNLVKVGHTMIFLRSIKPEDKSVALGTFETIICAFGFIPYPIVYGALVDYTCLIWEKSCGETGNCWYYDVPKLNYVLHGTSAFFSTFDACTLLGIFFLASRVHDLYKEDNETEKNEAESQGERNDSPSITNI